MKSVMNHSFSQIPKAEIQRSTFDRSSGFKATFDAGICIPVFVDEVLPGDTFNLKVNHFARLATPIKPIMDNMWMDTHFFFVPNRLLWANFEKFMGAQTNPGDSTSYTVPQVTAPGAGGVAVGTLCDYMGIPTGINSLVFNSLHLRAYNLIWNTWYRDENLNSSRVVPTGDGPDTFTDFTLQRRNKRRDYFTSCLPWPQKGPDVTLPLGTSAPVVTNNVVPVFTGGSATNTNLNWNSSANAVGLVANPGAGNPTLKFGNQSGLLTDLSTATSATINALRAAFQLQRLYERDARGGTRYTEILKAHFNVTSPDFRLQRPELLCSFTNPVNIHPVSQTAQTPVTGTPQGNLAGFGTSSSVGNGFSKSFVEHGVIIGIVSVRADLTYQQGLDRMWSRRTRFDFYWPALAHLGEQAVLNKEIYADGSANDALVFGYQERFGEYRYKASKITGKFRSTYSTPLDVWHLSQKFTSLPGLNTTFMEETPPLNRVIAVNTEPHFLYDAFFELKCARPMPVYSVPGLIDHL